MDIVTITDEALGLDQFPVRITRIEEDEQGELTVTTEELAVGSRSAIEYDSQALTVTKAEMKNRNVNAPVILNLR